MSEFDVIIHALRQAKNEAISQCASYGKKHSILKYPLFVLIVAFIFIYNFFLHLFIQMHLHKHASKVLACFLSISLVVSSISLSALAEDDVSIPIKITAFSTLSSDIAEQNLYVGDEESNIIFPSSLNVTIEKTEVVTTQKEKELVDNVVSVTEPIPDA